MARSAALPAAVLALLAAGCMRARGTPEEPLVREIRIRGAQALSPDEILEKIASQPSDDWAWQEARRLDPDALVVDRRRIEALYRTRGYYEARVTDVKVEKVERGRVDVVFQVVEGEPVRVTKVILAGLEDTPEAAALLGKLPLREGDVFTESAYDATRGLISSTLRDRGWATAEVSQRAQVFPPEHAAEVRYEVTPGRRWRFGPIQPVGTRTVSKGHIRRQAALEITPGEWWKESQLQRAQARVFGLGVFGGVRALRGAPDEGAGTIPVIVSVREAPFRTIRAGPRLGMESNVRWDLSATVGWTNRNWLGDLRRLQLDLRAGYAWVFNPNKEGWAGLASAEFSQPAVLGPRIDVFTRLELERGLDQAYDFWSERIRFGFPLRIAPRWTLVPSYNIELSQLSNTVESFDPNDPTSDLLNCVEDTCLLSYLEQRIGWDGRDDPIDTRRGLYAMLAVQEGFHVGGYGYTYLRFLPEARFYVSLGPETVLAARGRFGALVPVGESGDPPVVARFQGGGPASQRGYQSGRLSPMVYEDGDWVPVGGNGLFDASAELRFAISGKWGGALFVDAGNVSPPSSLPTGWRTALDPTILQWATGIGLRYKTPIGPIRIDVGFMVPTDWSEGVKFTDRFPTVPSVENAGDPIFDDAGNQIGTVPETHRENWFGVHLSFGESF